MVHAPVRRVTITVAAAATLCGALIGCSSSSSGTSSSGSNAPIKLMVIAPLSSPAVSIPEQVSGAQAAADSINAAGGVNGHKIDILSCNDQANANQAIACARDAVSDHVTAAIGLYLFGTQTMSVLGPAGIPLVDGHPESSNEGSNADVFPLNAGAYSISAGTGYVVGAYGHAKHISIIIAQANAGLGELAPLEEGIKASGAQIATVVNTPTGVTDYAPYIAEALKPGNVDGIAWLGQTSGAMAAITAARQAGFTGPFGEPQVSSSQSALATLGSYAKNVLLAGLYWTPPAEQANPFVQSIQKYEPSAPNSLDANSEDAWMEVYAVANAFKRGSGANVSAAALKNLLQQDETLDVGAMTPPVNFAKSGPLSSLPRFAQFDVVGYTVQPGKGSYVPFTGQYSGFFNPLDPAR